MTFFCMNYLLVINYSSLSKLTVFGGADSQKGYSLVGLEYLEDIVCS
jgi:hypothetical protein